MATKSSKVTRQTIRTGPYSGVFATRDPDDARPDFFVDALNGRVVDPTNKSGFYGRPAFRRLNLGASVWPSGRGQAIYAHEQLDGSPVNLIVIGGQVFLLSPDLTTFTNVTPIGVVVDPGSMTRVGFASLVGNLFATDGINRPWVATNLTSVPITGTYVDYDGAGVAWSTVGFPKVYLGSIFVILNTVNGVSRRADLSWCNPGTPTIGWQQADFDDNWTLSQNEAGPIFSLESDNTAIRYFRESSIGAASGQDVLSLASTATDDAVAFNIGNQAAGTVQKYGAGFFFIDAQGRPYYYIQGAAPDPIWKQMRAFVDAGSTNNPTTTGFVATAVVEPVLNLYIVAIWSPSPATQSPPIDLHVFDAQTRIYQGRWQISNGLNVECLGIVKDTAGRPTMIAVTSGGFVWAFSPITTPEEVMTTEGGALLLTEGSVALTTESRGDLWADDHIAQTCYALTDRNGYSADVNWNADMLTVITSTEIQMEITVSSAMQAATVQGTPTPNQAYDGTFRTVSGLNVMGRGPQVKIAPLNFDEQFILQSTSLVVIPSNAGPQDS